MYGAQTVNEWKRAHVTMLNPDVLQFFNSLFPEQCGPDDHGELFILSDPCNL
jgi:hypothetical protein